MNKGKKTALIQMLVIAALYIAITVIEDLTVGMTKDVIQVRISEALTVLPYFTPAAIPGLFIGCLVSNYIILPKTYSIMSVATYNAYTYDVIFGSLATLVGAIGTYAIRKYKFLAPLPPIVVNMFAVPLLFTYAYRFEDGSFWYYVATIGIGEAIACGVLGIALMLGLEDHKDKLFPSGVKKDTGTETEKEDKTGE